MHSSDFERRYLVVLGLKSSRIYIIDIGTTPESNRAPVLYKTIEGEELHKFGVANPHTAHCLPDGTVMISCLGDGQGNAIGAFVIMDSTFTIKGRWDKAPAEIGYDFWYQPRHNIMVSSEWGAPNAFLQGLSFDDVKLGVYGQSLHFWDWTTHERIQTTNLGPDGLTTLEVRFLHNPEKAEGFVVSALGSCLFRFYKDEDLGVWQAEKVLQLAPEKVDGWIAPEMPAVISDQVISLDDKYLYISNWLHGDIRQYDITNTSKPKMVGQVYLGGLLRSLKTQDPGDESATFHNHKLEGGPQMKQLSLDGKRLYVTNSLVSPWDRQFYPKLDSNGGYVLQIDVNTETGGLTLNQNFDVDLANEPEGPVRAHEVRFPGGDCTADVWV
jgi:selenium-binding protein 1